MRAATHAELRNGNACPEWIRAGSGRLRRIRVRMIWGERMPRGIARRGGVNAACDYEWGCRSLPYRRLPSLLCRRFPNRRGVVFSEIAGKGKRTQAGSPATQQTGKSAVPLLVISLTFDHIRKRRAHLSFLQSARGTSAPTGLRPPAQGCPRRAGYPGWARGDGSQPQRGCGGCNRWRAATPLGLGRVLPRVPRVARSSQPWAGGHSPVGAVVRLTNVARE